MNRVLMTLAAAAFLGACGTTVEGKLIDGMTGQPIPGKPAGSENDEQVQPIRIIAKAVCFGKKQEDGMLKCTGADDEGAKLMDNVEAGLTCMTFTADVAQDGAYRFSSLCTSKTVYQLSTSDKNLFLADIDELPIGHEGGTVDINVWRAPTGAGVFKLDSEGLQRIPSGVDLREDEIFGTGQMVKNPVEIPENIPLVAPGEHLVITGKENVAGLSFAPLINSGPRKLGNKDKWTNQTAWAYVGGEFQSDEVFEAREASVDASKVVIKEKPNHAAKYVAHDALPPGRYVLMTAEAKRATIVDFGEAGVTPKPAEEGGE